MDKYTGRELHMLRTLRQIYALLDSAIDLLPDHMLIRPLGEAYNIAGAFVVTGPTNAELNELIAEDRQSHGWPTQGA